MEEALDPLEDFWGKLLSRQPELIRQAFSALEEAEQKPVLDHLARMAGEAGWQPEQRESARAALETLERLP